MQLNVNYELVTVFGLPDSHLPSLQLIVHEPNHEHLYMKLAIKHS